MSLTIRCEPKATPLRITGLCDEKVVVIFFRRSPSVLRFLTGTLDAFHQGFTVMSIPLEAGSQRRSILQALGCRSHQIMIRILQWSE